MEADEIRTFQDDDAGYEAWVGAHGGYVLTTRPKGEYMLHLWDCGHLGRDGDATLKLTARPRRWASQRRSLIEWAVAETGQQPAFCNSCL